MENIKELIAKRRSVRTYSGTPLSDEDRRKLEEYVKNSDNPFGIHVEFRFLDAKEHDLSSAVIVNCDLYAAAKVKRVEMFEIAYGYSFEKFCLYALSLGLGTVMLAGTLSRKTFEKAMELNEDELMPVASPVGYFTSKKSLRERVMRKAIGADERLPFEELFYENSFDKGLTAEGAGKFKDALEGVRLAPSAVNKQPWRAVVCGDTVHFFEKKAKSLKHEGIDIQKIDMGIALSHFDLTLNESGLSGSFLASNPNFKLEENTEYIISYKLNS